MAMTAESAHGGRIPEWTLGERMKKARLTAGITREQMAKTFGKKEGTITAWETDGRNVGNALVILKVWAEITGVSYAWLTTGGVTVVTYADSPSVVENHEPRLPMKLPPCKYPATLTFIRGHQP